MMKEELRRKRARQRRNGRLERRRVADTSRSPVAISSPHEETIVLHVTQRLAAPAFVLHEIESEIVHLDVHVVPPDNDRDYWFLFTTGMSARPMALPAHAHASRLAEISIKLPRDWVFDRAIWAREPRWFWPIAELRDAAKLPHRHHTWLGHGHTILAPCRDSFDPSTRLSSSIVVDDVDELGPVALANGAFVDLLTLWPLHESERDYAIEFGSCELLDVFSEGGCDFVIDPDREPIVFDFVTD